MRKALIILLLLGFSGCALDASRLEALYRQKADNYQAQIKKNPADEQLRLKAAEFYYHFHEYDKTIELLKEVKEEKAFMLCAKAYARIGEFGRALELFERLGERSDDEYLYLYAQTAQNSNLYPKAAELYAKTGGDYGTRAKERLNDLGVKVEEGIPAEIKKLLSEHEPFLSQIKDEDAVTLLADEETEVNPNNTMLTKSHIAQKVLKEKGKEAAEVELEYDSTYERIELEFARTITAEGKVVYAGKQNIRDVSKYMNFPLYSNARALIVSMPSVEVGSIIEYRAKVYSSQMPNKDDFSFVYGLRDKNPVAREIFKLVVPKDKKVFFKELNSANSNGRTLLPAVSDADGKKIYTWDFKNVEPIIPEEHMPPVSLINPAVKISSFTSWQEIYAWWKKMAQDKMEMTGEMKDFLTGLIKDCKSDYEKLQKIHAFCAQNIRYVAVEYGQSGYEPHKAETVFLNRYGDCKDQAILLTTLLKAAGLKAYPVLIATEGVYDTTEDFPSINFNHAICCADLNGKIIFMDPTASTSALNELPDGDQDREVLVFFDDAGKIVKTPLVTESAIFYRTTIDIDPDEAALVNRQVNAYGTIAASQRYFLKYTHPEQIKEVLQEKMKALSPESELISYETKDVDDFTKTPVLAYKFKAGQILSPAGDLRVLPAAGDAGIDLSYAGKDKRKLDIYFDGLFKKNSVLNVNLPAGLKVKYLPRDKTITTPWFDFTAVYADKAGAVEVKQEFTIKAKLVKLANYQEFKTRLQEVFYLLREEIILEKKP